MAGWALGVLGPPLLTAALLQQRDILGLPTDLMFFFTLVVGTAITGGLFPSLVCALLGSSLLNYFFTEPTGGLTIAEPEQALALVLFALVAVAVASLVDVAERRSLQAREAQAEATVLSELSRAVLAGADNPQGLVDELARRFDASRAFVLERERTGAPWRTVASHPPGSDLASGDLDDLALTVEGRAALALPGMVLAPRDRRVLATFAAQAALVLERGRLRERAERAREFEQGNAVRTALLTAASHDLRTPLAAIRTAIDGLAAGQGPGDVVLAAGDEAVLLETIDTSTVRLERLIDNLLDLSMLHTGALRPELRAVSLEEVVPAAVEGLGAAAVALEVPESVPLVMTDPGLLERVLANLIQNAVLFAPTGSPVRVTAAVGASHVELHVIDSGPGVPVADRERMFEAFQRLGDVPAAPTRTPAGLGLGLAVAQGLSDAVGARLDVRDTPGGGLTMVLAVPRAQPDPASACREAGDGATR